MADPPLSLATAGSLQLLSADERTLCAELRMLPRPFLFVKQAMLRELARRGGRLRRADARRLLAGVEPEKLERVWDVVVGADDALLDELDRTVASPSPLPSGVDDDDAPLANGINGHVVDADARSETPMDVDTPA